MASRIDKLHVENDPPVELVEFAVTFFAAVHAVVEVGHLKNTLVEIFVSKTQRHFTSASSIFTLCLIFQSFLAGTKMHSHAVCISLNLKVFVAFPGMRVTRVKL